MQKTSAISGAGAFFAIAPGTVAGLVPWLLTDWHPGKPGYGPAALAVGWILLAAGAAVLIASFARFVTEGLGTPAPIAPTEHLVTGGLYRYIRNPIYVAVVACILGQALLLSRPLLFAYAAVVAVAFSAFVIGYEQPTLTRRYGTEYQAYRQAVPAWIPRPRRHI